MPKAQILEIDAVFTSNRSNAALGIERRALGIWVSGIGIGHWALGIADLE